MSQNLSSAAVVIEALRVIGNYLSNWTLRYGEAVGRVLYSVTLCTSWAMLNWCYKTKREKRASKLVSYVNIKFLFSYLVAIGSI